MDRLSEERRSDLMRRVKSKDTLPEMVVRRLLHGLGFRYRLHRRDLPGKPDIVFSRKSKIILVNGCYWHGHTCRYGRLPKSRLQFWQPKIEANRERDGRNVNALRAAGWGVLVVWQCETKNLPELQERLVAFLGAPKTDAPTTGVR
ncbi:MAG TPA: very short patch repair endonuclease [Terriglobales bacterium]|nr:very short patch repair endonuclease [Terriglobales bacterium]